MLIPSTEISEPTVRTRPTRLSVLLVGGDRIRDRIERSFAADETEVRVETVATLGDALNRPGTDSIDCLVVTSSATADASERTGDGVDALDDRLETIRAAAPDLPVVVLAAERTPDLADAVRSHDWTAVIERDETRTRFADRARDLLERHRLAALSRRSLASVEFVGDAIAVVDPDDAVQFASRSFAMQFGRDHASLPGTPWRELFTDDAVAHLESAAIPTVTEGWRWTGTCTARRNAGATFAAHVRLGGLEDGSLVFVVSEAETSDGLED